VGLFPDGTRHDIKVDDDVYQGEVITTDLGGSIGLIFADRTTFALNENARVLLDRLIYDPGAKKGQLNLSVLQGAFLFVSGEISKFQGDTQLVAAGQPSPNVSIRTPVATIGVRGTIGGADAQGEGGDNRFVLFPNADGSPSGVITVINGGGVQILDQPNQGTN